MRKRTPRQYHTFLFTVDAQTVIDAGVNGNEARYVNHGCDPNCQSVNRGKRIFIEALRTIRPGEELAYDYQIQRDADDPVDVDEIFACRCGALGLPRQHAGRARSEAAAQARETAAALGAQTAAVNRALSHERECGLERGGDLDSRSVHRTRAGHVRWSIAPKLVRHRANLRAARIGNDASRQRRTDIRGDFTCWLSEPLYPAERAAA